jgi:hypothetical protein
MEEGAGTPSVAASGGDGAAGDRHQREVEAKWKGNK